MKYPAADVVRSLLDYDPSTGVFRWRVRRNQLSEIGSIAGNVHPRGYRQIFICGHLLMAHRLAWLHFYGHLPTGHIDHIDGDKGHNAIANLRDATPAQNNWNKGLKANNKSGYRGVCFWKNRWRAAIKIHGKKIHLGSFGTAGEAGKAYADAARRLHGEFFRPE